MMNVGVEGHGRACSATAVTAAVQHNITDVRECFYLLVTDVLSKENRLP